MELLKLESAKSLGFDIAWQIYEASFPPEVRRERKDQVRILRAQNYDFSVAYEDNRLVGLLGTWNFDEFGFIEHIAIVQEMRSIGLGSRLLGRYMSKTEKPIALETERPDNDENIRRVRFFERNGFVVNPYDYLQPPYGRGKEAVPLVIMSAPEMLNVMQFDRIRSEIHKKVYGCKEPILCV